MKLPRLGNPTIRVIERRSLFGDRERIEITEESQFDLLPTWAQYVLLGIMILPVIALLGAHLLGLV